MFLEQFGGDGSIATTSKEDTSRDLGNAEFSGQRLGERGLSSTAGEKQGPVDIEQADVHGESRANSQESRARRVVMAIQSIRK